MSWAVAAAGSKPRYGIGRGFRTFALHSKSVQTSVPTVLPLRPAAPARRAP